MAVLGYIAALRAEDLTGFENPVEEGHAAEKKVTILALQAGEVRIKGLRHPCRNIPAVRFVIEVAALPSTFPYVDKGQTAERVTDLRCEADN